MTEGFFSFFFFFLSPPNFFFIQMPSTSPLGHFLHIEPFIVGFFNHPDAFYFYPGLSLMEQVFFFYPGCLLLLLQANHSNIPDFFFIKMPSTSPLGYFMTKSAQLGKIFFPPICLLLLLQANNSKFNLVFLSQIKSNWADFWICYSSNKT